MSVLLLVVAVGCFGDCLMCPQSVLGLLGLILYDFTTEGLALRAYTTPKPRPRGGTRD